MPTATCPTDPSHDQFETTAHVMESWRVDRHGNYLATIEQLETTHEPDAGNIWTCMACGAIAEVTTD